MLVRSIVTLCSLLVVVLVLVVVLGVVVAVVVLGVVVAVEAVAVTAVLVPVVVVLVPFTSLMLKSDATTESGTGLQAATSTTPAQSNAI